MKIIKLLLSINLVLFFYSCDKENKNDEIQLNTDLTAKINLNYIPEMVAPGIISKASFEGHASITPSGNEMYFSVYSNDHAYSTIAYSVKINSSWSEPEIVPFSGKYSDGSPALSTDGLKLFFSSRRPIKESEINSSNDIWFVERKSEKHSWSNPKRLSVKVNSDYNEFSPSVDNEGNLYFCSIRPNGFGDMDVYYSELKNNRYSDAILLSESINSTYHEGNVGVSPDGNLLFVMVQHKPGDYGYDDIHYSVKKDGQWSGLKNIGTKINTKTYDFSPKLSPNGKVLYFSSRLNRDFTKTDASYTYKIFQDYLNSPLNGLGNIYKIELDELNINFNE